MQEEMRQKWTQNRNQIEKKDQKQQKCTYGFQECSARTFKKKC